MKKLFLLALSDIRKTKGQSIAISVLLLVAAILLNTWLVVLLDYNKNFDTRANMLSSEDVIIAFNSTDESFQNDVENILRRNAGTEKFHIENNIFLNLTFAYAGGEMNSNFIIMPVDRALARPLGKYLMTEGNSSITHDTVYLPLLCKTGGGYNIGDKFSFEAQGSKYSFTIGGFFENMLAGSFNGGLCTILMENSQYENLKTAADEWTIISSKIKDNSQDSKYSSEIISEVTTMHSVRYNNATYNVCKQARSLTGQICAAIICAVAFIFIIIALIVAAFNITNGIDEDMKNLGALKSLGYKSSQLIAAQLLKFLLFAVISIIVGVALSYALLPAFDVMLIMQTGIPWEYEFCIIAAILSLLIITAATAITTHVAAWKISKITPIVALRQGVHTHNFKRNLLPLSVTKINVTAALATKNLLRNTKQNILIFIITIVLAFLLTFSGVMYNNFVIDTTSFINVVAGEQADGVIYTSLDSAEEIYDYLKNSDRVEKAYELNVIQLYHNGQIINSYVTDDTGKLNSQEMCYEGRMPKHNNEIALGGLYARENGFKVGDTITLSFSDNKADLLICGLIQSSNFLGKDCIILGSAAYEISPKTGGSYYFDVKPNVDINSFFDDAKLIYGDKVFSTVNLRELYTSSMSAYTAIVGAISISLIVLSLIVVAFVLYLMVKTFILRKRHDYGIYKALGYTTKQLVMQTTLSFMPTIIIATIIGVIISCFIMNPVITLLFQGIGVLKCNFFIPPLIITILALTLLAFAFGLCLLVSMRVRRITPKALMTGE